MNSKNFFLPLLLFFITAIYIFSLPPILSTGDGGELITASYGLGTPHPSGYPLYVQIGKLFSFFPVGNIGIRVELISVFFSIVTLFLVYFIIFKVSEQNQEAFFAAIASVIFLALSYSYFGQSIVAKFYTLNSFLVMLLLFCGIKLNGYDRRIQFLASFILGLTLSSHHTGFMMIIPLSVLGFFYFRNFLRNLPLSFLFFLLGFSVNLYFFIRDMKGTLFSMIPVTNLDSFIKVFLRKNYGAGSSIDVTASGFANFYGYFYAFKNYFYLIEKNFTLFSIPFFILGAVWLFKKSKRLFIFVLTSFFIYSIFLAKLTFSMQNPDAHELYVIGHQYFIPSFAIYCIFVGWGLCFIYSFFEKYGLNFLKRIVPVIVVFFPLLMIFDRLTDQYQGKNYVPYSHTKGIFTSLPVASIYMTYGDNHAFQGWYLKLVGRYREDICHIVLDDYKTMVWALHGCKPYSLYRGLFPEFFGGNLIDLTEKYRYYSIVALSEKHPLYTVVNSYPYFYTFIYLGKSSNKRNFDEFFRERMKKIEPFLNYEDCLAHRTDDLYTLQLCNFSTIGYLSIAKAYENLSKKDIAEILFDHQLNYGDFTAPFKMKLKIDIENEKYLNIYNAVKKYNKIDKFYLSRQKDEKD
ncbi:glycosyltransferase family 117 protein [Thermodesulfovibrio sp. TK110]